MHFASYSASIAILKFATHGKYNKCLLYFKPFLELSFRNYYLSMQQKIVITLLVLLEMVPGLLAPTSDTFNGTRNVKENNGQQLVL